MTALKNNHKSNLRNLRETTVLVIKNQICEISVICER